MSALFCACPCHSKPNVFCSCFKACCHEPHTPTAKQTAYPEHTAIPVKFVRMELPRIRTKNPKL